MPSETAINNSDIKLEINSDKSMIYDVKIESNRDELDSSSVLKAVEKCLMSNSSIRKIYEGYEFNNPDVKLKINNAQRTDFEVKLESNQNKVNTPGVLEAVEECLMSDKSIRKVYENVGLLSKESKAPVMTSGNMSNKEDVSSNDKVIQCSNQEITISCCWLHRRPPGHQVLIRTVEGNQQDLMLTSSAGKKGSSKASLALSKKNFNINSV